uniref:Spindle pole body component n=1 Tax=Albugo laibachii Nc14 TaxID=890382 RepID=F0WNF7_9STRA|nr:hypothetical protein PITG_18463 [Albugo laibachii Nc14]|eukprot:CCA22848.1 hypothetical protein PITG_18463 [Albugo laibachii Nc14]
METNMSAIDFGMLPTKTYQSIFTSTPEIAGKNDDIIEGSNLKFEHGWEKWLGTFKPTRSSSSRNGFKDGAEVMILDLKLSDCDISDLSAGSQRIELGEQDIVEESIKALSGVESVLLRRNLTSATFELPSYQIKLSTGSNKSITSALRSKLRFISQQNRPTLNSILFFTKSIRAQIQYIADLFQCDGSKFWRLLHGRDPLERWQLLISFIIFMFTGMFPKGLDILNRLHTEVTHLEKMNGNCRHLFLVTWLFRNTIKPYLGLLWEFISNGVIASTSDPNDEFSISAWSRENYNSESSATLDSTLFQPPDSGILRSLFPNFLTAKLASEIIIMSKAQHLLPPDLRITKFLQSNPLELPLIDIPSNWRIRQQQMRTLAELHHMHREDQLSSCMNNQKTDAPEVPCDLGYIRSFSHKRALSLVNQITHNTKRRRHQKQCESKFPEVSGTQYLRSVSHKDDADVQPDGIKTACILSLQSENRESHQDVESDQNDTIGDVISPSARSWCAETTLTSTNVFQVQTLSTLPSLTTSSVFEADLVSESDIVNNTLSLLSITRQDISDSRNPSPISNPIPSEPSAELSRIESIGKSETSSILQDDVTYHTKVDNENRETQPFVSTTYHHFRFPGISTENKAKPQYFFHKNSDLEEECILDLILDQTADVTSLMPAELLIDSFVGWVIAKLREFTELDIVKFISEKMRLKKHLEWLHKLVLMSESLCMDILTRDIHTKLFSSSQCMSMVDRSLNLMLQVALMETSLYEDEIAKCFSYSVDTSARASFGNPTALTIAEIVSKIQLSYEPLWPLHLIITPSSMQRYNQIHQFLLHLKLTKHQLEDVWQHVRRISPYLKELADTKALRHLEIIIYKIRHILSAVHEYFVTNVVLLKAGRLYETISTLNEVKLICETHEAFVHDISESCFLGHSIISVKIHGKLLNIFDFAWRLSTLERAASLHVDYNMAEMHQRFDGNLKELIHTLQSVGNNENSAISHAAQELLVRFDLTLANLN